MSKALLAPLLRWDRLDDPRPGYSIVLGTPWALRHLLEVNLCFVSRTDLTGLDCVIVVFDRVEQPGAEDFIATIREKLANSVPLTFRFHEQRAGRLIRGINQSKFYASMNWTTGIKHCATQYAIMHDFDLYPLVPEYFRSIVEAMEANLWRFSGAQHTHFDGLTEEDALLGTWSLGIDVRWLRANYRPTDCFHAVAQVNGRRVDLDAFSLIQSNTPQRGLAPGIGEASFAHVRNLCSTHLRFQKGERPKVVWRLHYLWYLQSLCGNEENMRAATASMQSASSPTLCVGECRVDFSNTRTTCANVLRDELTVMEHAVHGAVRPEVADFVDAYQLFLDRYGQSIPIVAS